MSSASHPPRWARWMEIALGHRAAAWVFAVAFVIHGVWSIFSDRHLHDEGLLTYIFSAWLADEPLATLFFQKAKPITALLYAPPSLIGLDVFLIAHVLVAAAPIPLIDRIARRLELPLPALPALLFAASPMYLGSAPAGLSNTDGVVAIVVFLYALICLERPLLAGVVLGCLPWVRYELFLLVAVFAIYGAIFERRLLVGMLAFPALYWLAGAVYHRALLWPLAFPPALPAPMPDNPVYAGELAGFGVAKVGLTLLSVSPAVLFAPMLRSAELTRAERAFALFALGYFVAMNVLPLWQIFNFGFTPRYSLGLLPALALFGGRAIGGFWRASEQGRATLPLLALLFLIGASARGQTPGLLWAAVVATALVSLVTWGRGRTASALAVLGAIAAIPLLEASAHVTLRSRHEQLSEVVRWLKDHRDRVGRGPVVTDITILHTLIERSGGLDDVEVRYLVGADQLYEIEHLANPNNGQKQRLLAALDETFYGRPIRRQPLTPEDFPRSAVFVLSGDERVKLILKEPIWRDRLLDLATHERYRILELSASRR